jgi:S-DNA-T family DNA segregation ATPase FtsK/SpoIIIE
MKPIRIVLSPTRNRPLNIVLGLMLALAALLLLLALATYHPSDPSLNTASGEAGPHAVRNWIGLCGAWVSDLLLQALGVTAFFLPLWLGGLGWSWIRSRPGGLAWLRWLGTVLALAFFPAVLALLPWHWHWPGLIPVGGQTGMLVSDLLVRYLNLQGAWLVGQLLGYRRGHPGPLVAGRSLARPLAQLARGARGVEGGSQGRSQGRRRAGRLVKRGAASDYQRRAGAGGR